MPAKKPPRRVAGPPSCEHCHKPCSKGVVRTTDGVFCSTKHRDAARVLRRAAAEPPAPVDVAEVISTALAIRTEQREQIVKFIAPPIGATADSWFKGKSPDTVASYRASVRHLVKWAQGKRYIVGGGDEIDGLKRIFLSYGQDEATALLQEWVREMEDVVRKTARSRRPRSAASIKTRCAGVYAICKMLRSARVISFLPEITRPRVEQEAPLDRVRKYRHVEGAFDTVVAKITELANKRNADALDVRDWAMINVAGQMGLRSIEVGRLDVESVDFAGRWLSIHGKGRAKMESMRIPEPTMAVLHRWLDVRSKLVGETGPLFYGTAERLSATAERLPRYVMYRMMRARAEAFGLPVAGLRPHDLRRVFVTEASERLGPERAMAITRHRSIDMVRRYDLREGSAMVASADEVGDAIARRGKK